MLLLGQAQQKGLRWGSLERSTTLRVQAPVMEKDQQFVVDNFAQGGLLRTMSGLEHDPQRTWVSGSLVLVGAKNQIATQSYGC